MSIFPKGFFNKWPTNLWEFMGLLIFVLIFSGALWITASVILIITGQVQPYLVFGASVMAAPYMATATGLNQIFCTLWLTAIGTPTDPVTWLALRLLSAPTGGQWSEWAMIVGILAGLGGI